MVEKNVAIINEVAIGIKQSDDGTQQLTIANEQITSTMQEVSGAALELANIANDLQVLVGKTSRPYASLTYEARSKGRGLLANHHFFLVDLNFNLLEIY